ncbi:MAG: hypothetical protein NPIRA04_23820 [Nitrospirales bacterium]|nr:MAG: hypothetical protein NPIRA04_23820 [Nitrospirales bacterium]
MIAKIFLCLAALLEGGALPYLLFTNRYQNDSLSLLILHVMVSIAVGLLGKDSLPHKYRQSPRTVVMFLTALTLFIPMLGAFGVMALVVMTNYFMIGKKNNEIQEIHDSKFTEAGLVEMLQFGGGDLQSRFQASALRTETRLDALGKLQSFESHHIHTTVREALQDQADDIRLVAFGILDKKEKSINKKINQELEWYQQTDETFDKLTHARQLAYAYWELVYKDVVEGDILTYALAQAAHYNDLVLATFPDDAGMWALKGQLALRSQEHDLAQQAFTNALEHGIPEARVIPYLAELAFFKKDFSALSHLFTHSQTLSHISILNPILKYWDFDKRLVREYASS